MMPVHNSSHITVTEIAFRARISEAASLFLSCRHCHFSGWLLDFAGSVWCTYNSICLLMPGCTQNASLLLIAANKMTDWQLQEALDSLFFQVLFFTASCPQLYSQPSQILAQCYNSYNVQHLWFLLIHTLFQCLAERLIKVHWFTACCSPHGQFFSPFLLSLLGLQLFLDLCWKMKDVNHLFLFSQCY